MPRRENDRYLQLLWLACAVVAGVVLFYLTVLARSGKVIPVLVGVGLSIAVALPVALRARQRIRRAFLQPDPELVIQALQPGGAHMVLPDAGAWRAYFEAWVYTLYGRFALARNALARIDWDHEPAIVRAPATTVEALLCFFHTRDFDQGLRLARIAQADGEVSDLFPGAKTALASYDSLVDIGRVLTAPVGGETVAKLHSYTQTLPFGASLIATWGLAAAHARAGDHVNAQAALQRCKSMAPHCAPLFSLPDTSKELR